MSSKFKVGDMVEICKPPDIIWESKSDFEKTCAQKYFGKRGVVLAVYTNSTHIGYTFEEPSLGGRWTEPFLKAVEIIPICNKPKQRRKLVI